MKNDTVRGFSLIELLLAVLIFSIVAVSVYSAFGAGVFAWRRLGAVTVSYQRVKLAMELLGNELANLIPSQKIKLEGEKDKISFLELIEKDSIAGLYKVSFYYKVGLGDEPNKIIRSQEDIGPILNSLSAQPAAALALEPAPEDKEFLSGIESLEFGYLCKAANTNDEYEWKDFLDKSANLVCAAVSISLRPKKDGPVFTKIAPISFVSAQIQSAAGSGGSGGEAQQNE